MVDLVEEWKVSEQNMDCLLSDAAGLESELSDPSLSITNVP